MILRLEDWTSAGIVVASERDGVPVDPTVAGGDPDEQIALDVHIGTQYWDAPGPRTPVEVNQHIVVDGGKAVRVRTKERFTVPPDVFGETVSRTSLTWSGIVAANIKVDPRFSGCLQITLFNVGTDRVVLDAADPVCSVVFQRITGDVGGGTRSVPAEPYRPYNPATAFYYRYRLAIATVLVAIIASVTGGVIVNQWGPTPSPPSPVVEPTPTTAVE